MDTLYWPNTASPNAAPSSSIDNKGKELDSSASASRKGKRFKLKKLISWKKKSRNKKATKAKDVKDVVGGTEVNAPTAPPTPVPSDEKPEADPAVDTTASALDTTAPLDDSMSMNEEKSVDSDGPESAADAGDDDGASKAEDSDDDDGATKEEAEAVKADDTFSQVIDAIFVEADVSKIADTIFSPMEWICQGQATDAETKVRQLAYSPNKGCVMKVGELPNLSKNDVLIRVDTTTISTRDSLEKLRRDSTKGLRGDLFVPGHEIIGKVMQVGKNVDKFLLGKRVAALLSFGGGCSHYVCINANDVIAVPEEASNDDAIALLSCYMTAQQCLDNAAANEEADEDVSVPEGSYLLGKNVLIFGAGSPLGLSFIDLAKNAGATVYTVSHSSHFGAITEMGADHWYRLSQKDQWSENWLGKIDLIVDLVGKHDDSDNNPAFCKVMKTGGRLATVNTASCEEKYLPLTRAKSCAVYKSMLNEKVFEYDMFTSFYNDPDLFAKDLAKLYDLKKAGKITPKINSRLGLVEVEKEWVKVMKGHTNGVVVVSPSLSK